MANALVSGSILLQCWFFFSKGQQLKNVFPLFMLSLVFWQWGGSRPLVLSTAFALVVFGLSTGLSLAVSRATASATGSPRIDVVECANCPFYFFDTMTIFPSVLNVVIWLFGLGLLWKKKIRSSGTLLVVFMLLFHLVGLGSGAAIAASLVPDGICVLCVVHLM